MQNIIWSIRTRQSVTGVEILWWDGNFGGNLGVQICSDIPRICSDSPVIYVEVSVKRYSWRVRFCKRTMEALSLSCSLTTWSVMAACHVENRSFWWTSHLFLERLERTFSLSALRWLLSRGTHSSRLSPYILQMLPLQRIREKGTKRCEKLSKLQGMLEGSRR